MAKGKAKKSTVKPSTPKKEKMFDRWQAAPLKGSFMATAMLGFFISVYYVYPLHPGFGFTFMIVFVAMFIATLISMTKAPILKGED